MKKSVIAIGLVACAALSGCVSVDKVIGPNGKQGAVIDCSGDVSSWNICYKNAAMVCPRGYDVIQRESTTHSYGNAMGSATNFGFSSQAHMSAVSGTSQERV
ncbi:MAG: hypothetical protein ACRCZ2_12945, partial [Fusobacteriaceae bacterium]